MSAEYDRLIADVMANAPGAVPATVASELMVTTRDFLQCTGAWQIDFEVDAVPTRSCYVITPPNGTAIHLLLALYRAEDVDRRPVMNGGFAMRVPGQIQLGRAPSQAEKWIATCSMYPVAASAGSAANPVLPVPECILEQYYETLRFGVIARMQLQPLKPYSNPQLAKTNAAMYRDGRAEACANLARANVWSTQAWRFPRATTASGRQIGA